MISRAEWRSVALAYTNCPRIPTVNREKSEDIMNTLFTTLVAKVRDEARNISGSNDRGPYSFYVVEILDQDDNKHEVTLPRGFDHASLVPGEFYVFDLNVTAKGGFLQLSAKTVTLHADYANA